MTIYNRYVSPGIISKINSLLSVKLAEIFDYQISQDHLMLLPEALNDLVRHVVVGLSRASRSRSLLRMSSRTRCSGSDRSLRMSFIVLFVVMSLSRHP